MSYYDDRELGGFLNQQFFCRVCRDDLPSYVPVPDTFPALWRGGLECVACNRTYEAHYCHACREAIEYGKGGYDADHNPYCYPCASAEGMRQVLEDGKGYMYLTRNVKRQAEYNQRIGYPPECAAVVGDWPGIVKIHCYGIRESWHNMAGKRYDYWFPMADGHVWHGYTIGDNARIAHVRRTKERHNGKVRNYMEAA